jgi:hypothetical protein
MGAMFGRRPGFGLAGLGLLAFGCGDDPEEAWTGSQACAVGIPPDSASGAIPSAQIPLGGEVVRSPDQLTLYDFTLGPIGDFSCYAPDEVTASLGDLVPLNGTLTQPVTVAPFDCWANDGRMYRLEGSGVASEEQIFFTQTFSAWFSDGEGILICTSTFREVQVEAAPASTEQTLPDETQLPPL